MARGVLDIKLLVSEVNELVIKKSRRREKSVINLGLKLMP